MENQEVENQEIDYKALYEEAQSEIEAKVSKVSELEWLIQKHKKLAKEEKKEVSGEDLEWLVEAKLTEREKAKELDNYLKTNNLSEYKDLFVEYTSKWLSLEDAEVLLKRKDPSIANREIANKTNFTSWEFAWSTTSYSQEQVSKMPMEQRKKVWQMHKEGKVKII